MKMRNFFTSPALNTTCQISRVLSLPVAVNSRPRRLPCVCSAGLHDGNVQTPWSDERPFLPPLPLSACVALLGLRTQLARWAARRQASPTVSPISPATAAAWVLIT